MNKTDARKELTVLQDALERATRQIEIYKNEITELEKILAEPDVDPREWIGKLCYFWDNGESFSDARIKTFMDVSKIGSFIDTTDCPWQNCRPVTLADLEEKIYQPKKVSRYDWDVIRRSLPDARLAVTNENGKQYIYIPGKPFQNASGGWDVGIGAWELFKVTGTPCPDWRDSLEEKPEGV